MGGLLPHFFVIKIEDHAVKLGTWNFIKIGTIAHFDDTSAQKKIQNDSNIFYVVMTSSFFVEWHHFRRFWWRHNDVKNVRIILNFFMRTFIVKVNNSANFYKNRSGRSLFSGNFFVLFYFTRLWDNGGLLPHFPRSRDTLPAMFFPRFFRQKFEKEIFITYHI